MCGIAGIFSSATPVDERAVRDMTEIMQHRGPIENGYFFRSQIGLGMRRLSIIDIEGGHQPLFNEDGSIAVILNGQIYNYRELRADLIKRGHALRTESDTEVIAHLYEEMGEQCLTQLNGMFAIALWDENKKRLFIARDRLGVKPLYYYDGKDQFAFGSELKALLRCPSVPKEIDPEAIAEYLTLMYVRAPRTPLKNIRKLLPGHYLTVDAQGLRVRRYWDLRDHYDRPTNSSEPEAIERVLELLKDSVRLRLRSDVPVGAFLSGGLDSSAIVAFASQFNKQIDTYSVGFDGDGFDELGYARVVSKAFQTRHHEKAVKVDDAIKSLPKLVWHLDEPNADSAIVPTFLISEAAGRDLRVILSGLGGDELFGGYRRYFDGYAIEHLYRRLPISIQKHMVVPLVRSFKPGLASVIERNQFSDAFRYLTRVTVFSDSDRQNLMGPAFSESVSLDREFNCYPNADHINRSMFVDMLTYLPDDILHITDRMSMAVSLEARTPFLDYRLVEFCAGLPGSFKVGQIRREWKRILKKAFASILPREILVRPKWGFGAPVNAWMHDGLGHVVTSLYRESKAVSLGLFTRAGLEKTLTETRGSEDQFSQKLWTLLILEVWCRVFSSSQDGGPPSFTLDDLTN
jgi:asparagine synthase (glutamine-hydrolysing)